jgi:hypothetical protein
LKNNRLSGVIFGGRFFLNENIGSPAAALLDKPLNQIRFEGTEPFIFLIFLEFNLIF